MERQRQSADREEFVLQVSQGLSQFCGLVSECDRMLRELEHNQRLKLPDRTLGTSKHHQFSTVDVNLENVEAIDGSGHTVVVERTHTDRDLSASHVNSTSERTGAAMGNVGQMERRQSRLIADRTVVTGD